MNIIGINGFKRSGKGETGKSIDLLCEGVHLLGFADKLKILAARTLGYLPADFTDEQCIALMDEAKEKWALEKRRMGNNTRVTYAKDGVVVGARLSMRQYLQNLGNEARGVFGDDFWVDQVLPKTDLAHVSLLDSHESCRNIWNSRYPGAATIAFTDLRYPNEAERILDLGGFVIEVVRPGVKSDGHASEKPLPRDLVSYQVVNDKGLKDLQWEVNKVLELEGLC